MLTPNALAVLQQTSRIGSIALTTSMVIAILTQRRRAGLIVFQFRFFFGRCVAKLVISRLDCHRRRQNLLLDRLSLELVRYFKARRIRVTTVIGIVPLDLKGLVVHVEAD